jgi:hypothetical protein
LLVGGTLVVSAFIEANRLNVDIEEFTDAGGPSGTLFGVEETYSDTVAGQVTLPEGFVQERGDFTKGYGWEYIQATSEISRSQIEEVLNNGRRVEGEGDVEYVIGNSQGESVILSIIGGVLRVASTDGYTNDPCDQSELVDLEYEEDHYTRNPEDTPEKPYDDRSTVKKLLDDGIDTALETVGGGKRYYIKEVGENQWTVILLLEVTGEIADQMSRGSGNPFTDWFVKTFLTDTNDGKQFFDSKEEARDAVDEEVNELDC